MLPPASDEYFQFAEHFTEIPESKTLNPAYESTETTERGINKPEHDIDESSNPSCETSATVKKLALLSTCPSESHHGFVSGGLVYTRETRELTNGTRLVCKTNCNAFAIITSVDKSEHRLLLLAALPRAWIAHLARFANCTATQQARARGFQGMRA